MTHYLIISFLIVAVSVLHKQQHVSMLVLALSSKHLKSGSVTTP